MMQWPTHHRISAVTLSVLFALAQSLREPFSHLDLRELARVVACHDYNCITKAEKGDSPND